MQDPQLLFVAVGCEFDDGNAVDEAALCAITCYPVNDSTLGTVFDGPSGQMIVELEAWIHQVRGTRRPVVVLADERAGTLLHKLIGTYAPGLAEHLSRPESIRAAHEVHQLLRRVLAPAEYEATPGQAATSLVFAARQCNALRDHLFPEYTERIL